MILYPEMLCGMYVLLKCGVPPAMLSIIQSFHEKMEAGFRVGDTVTNKFEVRSKVVRWHRLSLTCT